MRPKVSQAPPESDAESRSTTSLDASRPAPASEPQSSVSGTDAVVYQGPAASAALCPVGAVVSFVTVNVAVAVASAPFVTVTVCDPDAAVVSSHVYVLV